MMVVNIAEDFSRVPAGRYHPKDGNRTGERFRNEFLKKFLDESEEEIKINLDGAVGYPSSFLEEAFGGLVRDGFTLEVLKKRLSITTTEARKNRYIAQIWQYIEEAKDKAVA
ncbi:STAS-like domain-containing protein [Sulfitobacter sp. S223]|uniref:STAS-like domain-containing protein n=1 Tax=Sulfitobacter sp. S223 TaxID=2867023 RepID=UPI0021A30B9F|nr:STAS-like domain-containing protein [Sulfitobacter sp. S223]UWR27354.1 STAS-like domain-containing protein [Sulfitobacter sp. S223]